MLQHYFTTVFYILVEYYGFQSAFEYMLDFVLWTAPCDPVVPTL